MARSRAKSSSAGAPELAVASADVRQDAGANSICQRQVEAFGRCLVTSVLTGRLRHGAFHRSAARVPDGRRSRRAVGRHRAIVQLQRYLATGDQHVHDDRDVPHGVPHSAYAKPRHACAAGQAFRIDHVGAEKPKTGSRPSKIYPKKNWKRCTRTTGSAPSKRWITSKRAADSSSAQAERSQRRTATSLPWRRALGMHVLGKPVRRQIMAEAHLPGLAVHQRAGRRELIAKPDIVDEAGHLVV